MCLLVMNINAFALVIYHCHGVKKSDNELTLSLPSFMFKILNYYLLDIFTVLRMFPVLVELFPFFMKTCNMYSDKTDNGKKLHYPCS